MLWLFVGLPGNQGYPVGFLLLRYLVLFTVEFLSLLGPLFILCTISLAISYVSHVFCAHLCAVPINFHCNDENRILGK